MRKPARACPRSSRGPTRRLRRSSRSMPACSTSAMPRPAPPSGPVGPAAARLALRHSQLCRCRAAAGAGGLPGDRPASARLRHHALSCRRGDPQRRAGGACRRYHRADGRAENREGRDRRLRLGRAHRQHHRRGVAGTLQGDGLGQRLSDRQPGGRQDAAAAEGRAAMVVSVLFRDRARPRRLREEHRTISPS